MERVHCQQAFFLHVKQGSKLVALALAAKVHRVPAVLAEELVAHSTLQDRVVELAVVALGHWHKIQEFLQREGKGEGKCTHTHTRLLLLLLPLCT